IDHQRRSLKSQFKLADKLGASLVFVLGPDELAHASITARNMDSHEEKTISLDLLGALCAKLPKAPFEGAAEKFCELVFGPEKA
ncbi:MAG: His/Gly/Thr/Pro-type tRNA ligase C-terminal domain-containing protein, partial [Eggerthellaceae bacterium]|nr:His/Gly/Thr/Pro-type tRNA ligase C-terminal domain-containing protein [Eggerthellaceae bacterium]